MSGILIMEFRSKWGDPCESCMHFYDNGDGQLRREAIRPLFTDRVLNPLSKNPSIGYICHDCSYAEDLSQRMGITVEMARVAVANDRQEKMRIPSLSHDMGLPGIRTSEGELEAIWEWLDEHVLDDIW